MNVNRVALRIKQNHTLQMLSDLYFAPKGHSQVSPGHRPGKEIEIAMKALKGRYKAAYVSPFQATL